MGREDADVAEEMSRVLSAEGIDILLGAETVVMPLAHSRGETDDAILTSHGHPCRPFG